MAGDFDVSDNDYHVTEFASNVNSDNEFAPITITLANIPLPELSDHTLSRDVVGVESRECDKTRQVLETLGDPEE